MGGEWWKLGIRELELRDISQISLSLSSVICQLTSFLVPAFVFQTISGYVTHLYDLFLWQLKHKNFPLLIVFKLFNLLKGLNNIVALFVAVQVCDATKVK